MDGKTKNLITAANAKHDLGLTEADVYYYDGELYISTTKAAQFLRATYHSFTNYLLPHLMGTEKGTHAWVRRAILGQSKWYALSDLEAVMDTAIKENLSIFDVCKRKPGKK